MKEIGEGVIVATVTLFKPDYSIDEEGMREQIDFLVKGGVDGIIVLGSLGEFTSLSHEERKKVAEICVEQAGKRVPILIGTAHTSTDEVIILTKHAKDTGADGVIIVTPYYWPLSDEALYQHYKTVTEEVDIPIFVYNFPATTGINVSPGVIAKLGRDYDNIIGLKDSIDSVEHMQECLKLTKGIDFKIIAGIEDHALSILSMGGHGFVSGTANFAPKYTVNIYKYFHEGKIKKAIEEYWRLVSVRRLWEIKVPAPVLLKFAISQTRKNLHPTVRRPLLPLTDEQKQKAKKILKEAGLIKGE